MTVKELIDELMYCGLDSTVRLNETEEILIGIYEDTDENGNATVYLEIDKSEPNY